MSSSSSQLLLLLLFFVVVVLHVCHGQQQPYIGNSFICNGASDSSSLGYSCSGGPHSCASYLTFRSTPPYQSPLQIAHLLSADATAIAATNGIGNVDSPALPGELILVPITCSCVGGGRYQHNASYVVDAGDTYFSVANDTYQGLSTCQAVMAQNTYVATNFTVGVRLVVPLRCACPTADQIAGGIKYLLTYLVTWGDDLQMIARRFPTDYLFVLMYPNNLTANTTLYPFSTLLVPLGAEPAARVPTTSLLADESGRIGDRDLRIKIYVGTFDVPRS